MIVWKICSLDGMRLGALPFPFSTKIQPSSFKVWIFRCTLGLLYIIGLMLLANTMGAVVERMVVVSKLSAMPLAALPMVLAEAGAISSKSDWSEVLCPGSHTFGSSNWSISIGFPYARRNGSGVIKLRAFGVNITFTSAFSFRSIRMSPGIWSTGVHAVIPMVMFFPISIFISPVNI